MILFAKETGMRREEITKIEWSHIREWELSIPETKNGEQRTIPLTKKALEILEDLREQKKPFNTSSRRSGVLSHISFNISYKKLKIAGSMI